MQGRSKRSWQKVDAEADFTKAWTLNALPNQEKVGALGMERLKNNTSHISGWPISKRDTKPQE